MGPADSPLMEYIQPVIQLVTAGGFGALVWYLVVKHIPAIEDRHKNERNEWLTYISHRDDKFEKITTEFTEAVHESRQSNDKLRDKISDLEYAIKSHA